MIVFLVSDASRCICSISSLYLNVHTHEKAVMVEPEKPVIHYGYTRVYQTRGRWLVWPQRDFFPYPYMHM